MLLSAKMMIRTLFTSSQSPALVKKQVQLTSPVTSTMVAKSAHPSNRRAAHFDKRRQQRREDFQKRCLVFMLCALALATTRIPEPTVRSPPMDWHARISSLNDRRFKVIAVYACTHGSARFRVAIVFRTDASNCT